VNGSDALATRVVLDHGYNLVNLSDGVRQGAICDRVGVVLDLCAGDTQAGDVRGEV
jgi:hypothetical protein